MRVNENTAIVSNSVVLVPYRKHHVQQYHLWMQSSELQELTASEPLTLQEEYEMQEKWRIDDDKLTFIILALPEKSLDVETIDKTSIDTLPMIGDVNLFLASSVDETELEGEVEIMIAEPAYRRRGLARAALSAFLRYATSHEICFVSHEQTQETIRAPINPSRLLVRIGQSNTPSIALFSKLGFTITKEANVFGEVEMRFTSGDEEKWWGQQSTEIVYPE